MENLSNIDDPNKKPHPKPTDDPGAEIETVTPDSQGLEDDAGIPPKTNDESAKESEIKVDETSKDQEESEESAHPEIETVTPDNDNKDLPDDGDIASEDSSDHQGTVERKDDAPDTNQDKNEEDGSGIETVTP